MSQSARSQSNRNFLLGAAWVLVLLVSDLPDVLWNRFIGEVPGWLFWAQVGILGLTLVLSLLWISVRPLWQFAVIFLVFYLAQAASNWIYETPFYQERFTGEGVSFPAYYLAFHIKDLGIALAVIAALWIIKRRRSAFFLVKGDVNAPIEPVRWLGIGKGESWRTFGWIFAGCAGLAVLIVVLTSVKITPEVLRAAAPLLPLALVLAGMNAFAEEVYYRSSMLSTLHDVIGNGQALLMSCVYFGLEHYLYGSPPGIIGFLMTGFLAYLMGKSILETKGLLWAWVIHIVPDTFIFAWYALAWVQ